jgi:uncharacterized protein YciI
MTSDAAMNYYALFYDAADEFISRRQPYRDEHLRLVREAHARGEVALAGALGEPPDGALLVFRADSVALAEAFARSDPYVVHGLITRWHVRPWNVVVGRE